MKQRSGFSVMARLVGLVRPLVGYMLLAIAMGLLGHACAALITVFGGYALLELLHFPMPLGLGALFACMLVFAVLRGAFRYAEQTCNHFIAFKLLARIRDQVFRALRRLCPAKLEGRDKGNLISVITSDIELLEVFYAHTISPAAIALLFSAGMSLLIGHYHWALGLLALAAYVAVGVIVPLVTSRCSKDTGLRCRTKAGELSAFVLDSLRGLPETVQYGQGTQRLAHMNAQTDALAQDAARLKRISGRNAAAANTVILLFDLAMLFIAAALYRTGRVGFDGVLIPTLALFSSFGPVVALANLGSTLQSTFAAGNRVLDILDETPAVAEVTGAAGHCIYRRGCTAHHILVWRGNGALRCVGHGAGACDCWYCRPQRQRKIHAAEAAHALLGRAAGECAYFRYGHFSRQHGEPARTRELCHTGHASVPRQHSQQPAHCAPRRDRCRDRGSLPQGGGA